MFQKDLTVTFVDESDLFVNSIRKKIKDIDFRDFKDLNIIKKSEMAILIKDGEKKIIKCRY